MLQEVLPFLEREGFSAAECAVCPAGFACPAITDCTRLGIGEGNCQVWGTIQKVCADGFVSDKGATQCTECEKGRYSSIDNTVCEVCPLGTWAAPYAQASQ